MAIDPPHPRSPSPSVIEHLRRPSAVATIRACSCGYMVERNPDGTQRLWPALTAHLPHLASPGSYAPTSEIDRFQARMRAWAKEMDKRGGIYAGNGNEEEPDPPATTLRAPPPAHSQEDPPPPADEPPAEPHSEPTAKAPKQQKEHRRSLRG